MPLVTLAVTVVAGYLLGSLPVAGWVARRCGVVDLREVGDRNPGYWNAKETLGRRAALPVFVGDVTKGAAAAAIGRLLAADEWLVGYAGGAAAMIGHAWPVFAGFRGGRSVLTFVGASVVLSPVAAASAAVVLGAVTAATRSFAWGTRVAVAAYPVAQLVVDGPSRTAASGALMCFIGLRFALASRAIRAAAPTAPAQQCAARDGSDRDDVRGR